MLRSLSATLLAATHALEVIKVPYDGGANVAGSRMAPARLASQLGLRPCATHTVAADDLQSTLARLYCRSLEVLQRDELLAVLGGDHSLAIASVAAAHTSALPRRLGVLWCDAHADFNTLDTSPTKNAHGMPVAALCGHTLPELRYGQRLQPAQFAYFGLRDVDDAELPRLVAHDMVSLDRVDEVAAWLRTVDLVHVSLDADCLYEIRGVNTRVRGGPTMGELEAVLALVAASRKLRSFDLVEFNPLCSAVQDVALLRRLVGRLVAD